MEEYTLYVFVRNDLQSLTTGRVAAQICHAGSQLGSFYYGNGFDYVDNWHNDNGFGRTIVLSVNPDDQNYWVNEIDGMPRMIANKIIDPDYTIRDGNFNHVLKDVWTCSYIFCPTSYGTANFKFPLYGA